MGADFSVRRLDALEAKIQRLEYLQRNDLGLVNLAKQELFMFCLWSAQMRKKYLSGAERENCEKEIRSVWKLVKDGPAQTLKTRIWITMARIPERYCSEICLGLASDGSDRLRRATPSYEV